MNATVQVQKNYQAVKRLLRFHRLPIQEKSEDGELVLLTASDKNNRDPYYELTVMNKNGNTQVSRIYKSGKQEIIHGNWLRIGITSKMVRILNELDNGETIQMCMTGNKVTTHRVRAMY